MSVQFGGLISGMNTNQMISQLVALERQPLNKMTVQKRNVESDLRTVGDITSKLKAFEEAAKAMSTSERFMSFAGKSSKADSVGIKTSQEAAAGSFEVSVEQLAKPARLRSEAFSSLNDTFDAGQMTISVFGEDDLVLDIPQGSTLGQVQDLIRDSGAKVDVTIVDTGNGIYLNAASKKTGHGAEGPAEAFTIAFDGMAFSTTQEAQNARFEIDGLLVERSTNTVSDAIQGVTFELKAVDQDVKIDIAADREAVLEKAKGFVEAYNKTVASIRTQSDAGNKRRFEQDLNSAVSQAVVSGPFQNLRSIGIELTASGTLALDETTFIEKLEADVDAVSEVFAGQNGVVSRALEQVDRYTKQNGVLRGVEAALNERTSALGGQIERRERSVEAYETRLRRRFATLEQLLVSLNDQSASYASMVPPSFYSNR